MIWKFGGMEVCILNIDVYDSSMVYLGCKYYRFYFRFNCFFLGEDGKRVGERKDLEN